MTSAETVVGGLAGFRDLGPQAAKDFASRLEVTNLAAGDVLFERGAAGDGLHLVLDGFVEVRDDAGRAINRLGTGALVGLVAMSGQPARTATVVADTDVEVASLGRAAYDALPEQAPEIGVALELAIATQLASDMRNLAALVRDALDRQPA